MSVAVPGVDPPLDLAAHVFIADPWFSESCRYDVNPSGELFCGEDGKIRLTEDGCSQMSVPLIKWKSKKQLREAILSALLEAAKLGPRKKMTVVKSAALTSVVNRWGGKIVLCTPDDFEPLSERFRDDVRVVSVSAMPDRTVIATRYQEFVGRFPYSSALKAGFTVDPSAVLGIFRTGLWPAKTRKRARKK